ncbi:polyketide synthase [Seiridium cupressi]
MAPAAIIGEGATSTVNGQTHEVSSQVDGQVNGGANSHANGPNHGLTNGHVNGLANGLANVHISEASTPTSFATPLTPATPTTPTIPTSSRPKPPQMPIAIVGMSCRLPGHVATPGEFWEMLARARSGYSAIPEERFSIAPFHHPNPGKAGCANPVGGHFLDFDLESFDAPFFSLTEKEAISMDPQQRLLLEGTFEALEHAGIPKQSIVAKDVGVFIGGSFPEYESHLFRDSDTIPMHQATGCAYGMQSNRLSHFFDLKGPSFTSDTACSSSLVALHLACQSLRTGESSMAITGGCHLNMLPEFYISFAKSRLFSDSGRSYSFDDRGTGFGRGEGCGVIILKPLDQAIKDGDHVKAIIAGSGINQDGRTPGITMPCGEAQRTLMQQVYDNADLDPKEVGFIEAHGTGTRVGDPIEANALHDVFGSRGPRDPLFLGSLKSNIGHLEGTSGIVAVIKAAMMLERGFILPNYDFKKPNPKIPWKEWNYKVPVTQRPWPRNKKYISVNNFGFGGTNAHVVLEKVPFTTRTTKDDADLKEDNPGRKLFVMSANDKNALETVMKNLVVYLEQRPEMFQKDLMGNFAYTLCQRRSLLQHRVAISAQRSFDLVETISAGNYTTGKEGDPLRIGFIFTGQGAQWFGMGRELYEQYPVYKNAIDRADSVLKSLGASWSLIEELSRDEKTTQVGAAHISQPSCTAVQLALVDLLRSWGIHPAAVTGHSSGEIGAAYAAGILDFDSGMTIAYHRGRLIPVLKERHVDLRGSMMAVGGSKEEFEPLLAELKDGEVKIACYNSPTSLTISGDEAGIDELKKLVDEKQMFNRKLFVDTAYHSHHMNLLAKDYQESIGHLPAPASTNVRFHSSLLGKECEASELEPTYWVQNLTCAVRFNEAVQSMLAPIGEYRTGVNMLIELGPHSALQGPLKQILQTVGGDAPKIPYAAALGRKKDAVETALALAGTLFTKGHTLDFDAINFPKEQKTPPQLLTDLPRYPWNKSTKYWHDSRLAQKHKHRSALRNDILGTVAHYSNDLEPTWRNIIRTEDLPWLEHHKVQGVTVFPMSGFITMAIEAAAQRAASTETPFDKYQLRDVSVIAPLVIPDADVEMTTTLRPDHETTHGTWDEFRICSWSKSQGWKEHCKGFIAVENHESNGVDDTRCAQEAESLLKSTISSVEAAASSSVSSDKLYDVLSELGVSYGTTFQGLSNVLASDDCSKAELMVTDIAKEMPNHHVTPAVIQPAFLESLISMYWPIADGGRDGADTIYLPSAIERITVSKKITEATKEPGMLLNAYSQGRFSTDAPKSTKITMFAASKDEPTHPLIAIEDLTISPIIDHETAAEEAHKELCYKMAWEPILDSEPAEPLKPTEAEVIIVHSNTALQGQIATGLAGSIEKLTGKMPQMSDLLSAPDAEGKLAIFLPEIEKALLSTIKATEFDALQNILTKVQGALWVVRGAYQSATSPDMNMVAGLSRTIRSETLLPFATLDLDGKSPLDADSVTEAVLKVFQAIFSKETPTNCEMEYSQRDGKLFTPRIINDAEMNAIVHQAIKSAALQPTPFGQDDRSLKLKIGNIGALETLHFVDDESKDSALGADEIEVQVKAVGLNHRDLTAAHGKLATDDFGVEASGTVTKIGSKVSNVKVGDRVAAMTHGAFATSTRTKSTFAFKLPSDMSFETGASLPLAYTTAYYSLIELGRLQEDESVLIHAAARAVGQAAISLAQMIGADVFVTVGSSEKKEFLMEQYNIPEDHIFYSRNNTFGKSLRQVTNGSGVDVVLNCLAGDAVRESWDCLNKFGRLIDVGTRISSTSMKLEMDQFEHNSSFMTVDMMALAAERPKLFQRVLADVSKLIKYSKVAAPSPITAFPMSEVETALKSLQTGSNAHGKLVVVPHADDIVKATPPKKPHQLLKADGTYILIGGTGGLGRSISRWMIKRGARKLVLVSRSGSETGKVKELIDEASEQGASVVVRRCDVANPAEVEELVNHGLEGMPPVRGFIHGAMVLHDVLYEKMTYDQYTSVIESKVQGGWNFHNALTNAPLDFFVAISSVAGAVGNRGQAAYAAANCFLNSLVQYRLAHGLPASSLDLTAISDTGYLAEDAEKAAEVAKNLAGDSICEAEVLALLGTAISGKLGAICNNHTITGMRITPEQQPFWTQDAKCKHLREAAEAAAAANAAAGGSKNVSWNAAAKAAKTLEEAEQVVCDGLVEKCAAVMMMEKEDLDVTRALSHYPLDSLVAIEIRNFITREFEATLQVLELLSSGSLQTLAKGVCVKSKMINF